jgi:3-phenylpropionate/trans-cinnamate dioxygenase ferredoxin component
MSGEAKAGVTGTADGTWVRVAALSQCDGDGCVRAASGRGHEVVLVRWADEVFALEDNCSHQDYPLSDGSVEDGEIECVFHGAKFDVRTGKATHLPAIRPVRTYPVRIEGDDIFIQVD